MKISGFSYGHNLVESGYPFVEAIRSVQNFVDELVFVDCQSTDGTRKILDKLDVRVIDGHWGGAAGVTLANAHTLNTNCENDLILHFEADEIYEPRLIKGMIERQAHSKEMYNFGCYRLQLELNFQRCRWYPEPVHRMFKRGTVKKEGHTTNCHKQAVIMPMENGLLWDITNCFKNHWVKRTENQAKLWGNAPSKNFVPKHFKEKTEVENMEEFMNEDFWHWRETPFKIPDILKPLVGHASYRPRV